MEVTINAEQFYSRLNKLHSHWLTNKTTPYYDNCNYLCIPMGAVKGADVIYSKSSAIHLYLLGYEFPESILILTTNKLYFITTQKKAIYLEAIKDDNQAIKIETLYKTKDEDANKELLRKFLQNLKKNYGTSMGTIVKGDFEGKFIPLWNECVQSESITTVDITRGLGVILAVKDATELVLFNLN